MDPDGETRSKSLWRSATSGAQDPIVTSASIISGESLVAQGEVKRLSTVEKNRAFVEQNIPFGDASRVLSLFSCLQCMGASRVLPVDHLERVLNDKKVAADVAGALVPVLLCILVCALGDFIDGDNPLVGRTLGLTVLIAGWWLAAPWPEVATSWAPVWLFPLAGIISAGDAAGKYMNNVTMLLIGAFLVDLCVEESGAGTRLGLVVIKRFGKQPLALILGFMTVAGVLSMFIGNTAVCMMMMPFILSIIERIDEENKDDNAASAERFAKASLLGVAYASSIGGMGTTIGTAPNLILVGLMGQEFGSAHEPTFTEWFAMSAPVAVLLILMTYVVVVLKWCRNMHLRVPVDVASQQLEALGSLGRDEKVVLFILAVQIALWFSRRESFPGSSGWSEEEQTPWRGESSTWGDGGVALMGAFVLFLIPSGDRPGEKVLTYRMTKHLPWDIIVLMGGGFAIAEAVTQSGTAEWLADHLGDLAKEMSIIPFLMCLCTCITFMTEICSNTATATIVLPVLIPAAEAANIHPLALLMPTALACSTAFMLPTATAPNAIVFSMKRLSIKDMAETGIIVNIMASIVLPVLIVSILYPIGGIGTISGAHGSPSWASSLYDDDAFQGCRTMQFTTETLREAIGEWCDDKEAAKRIWGDIADWDTSQVTDMSYLFNDWDGAPIYCSSAADFNEDITKWNTGKVKSLYRTFCFAYAFNQDISSWNTSSITSLRNTFSHALAFDQDISAWDTSGVATLRGIFYDARVFNQKLDWDVSNVETFQDAFGIASSFSQSLCWNIPPGAITDSMFAGTAGSCIDSACGSASHANASAVLC